MARLDKAAIVAALSASLPATVDETGGVDLVADKGSVNVAAEPGAIDQALAGLKPLPGYRWLAINASDLFVASPKTIGTKVGIMDATGRVLKAADLPRPR
jgi:hypothetical protein